MRIRPKVTYANVMVTLLAFVVLLGGGAYAASKLDKNSVGKKQIKRGAVTSAKVKDGSLRPEDLAAGVLPAGAAGFQATGSVNFDSFSSSLFGSTVVTLNVPPGNYFATSSVEPQTVNPVAGNVTRRLIGGPSSATTRSQIVRADTEPENFTLSGLFSVPGNEALSLQCSKENAGSSARIVSANIVALRVGAISGPNE